MEHGNIDNLTRPLERVRLNGDSAMQEFLRRVGRTRVQETTLLARLEAVRAANKRNRSNQELYRRASYGYNTLKIDDTVCITNRLWNKHGTTGVVQISGRQFVEILSRTTS